MARSCEHLHPRPRDQLGQRLGVRDRRLGVELADEAQRGHGDRPEHGPTVVRHEALDRAAQRRTADAGHRRPLPRQRVGRDVRPGDAGQHCVGEIGGLATGVERRQPSGAPRIWRCPVEAEARARRQQCERGDAVAVGHRRVLGDHAAERDAGEMDLVGADLVGEGGHGVGETDERHWAVVGWGLAVSRLVPCHHSAPVGQSGELGLPGEPAAPEPVEQHERRSVAVARLPPGEPVPTDIGHRRHRAQTTTVSSAMSSTMSSLLTSRTRTAMLPS